MSNAASAAVHVLCTRPLSAAHLERLKGLSPRLRIEHRLFAQGDVAEVIGPDVEVLLSTFPPHSAAAFPALRWYQSTSAGVDRVLQTPFGRSSVRITTTSGLHAITVGEYTLGLMIALARDFLGYLDFQRRACWPQDPLPPYEQFPGRDLRGSSVLIIGYGSIGRQVARLCDTLGMRVIAVKRDPSAKVDEGFGFARTGDPAGELPERIVGPAQLHDVLPEADFIVLAAPSTAGTRHLLGQQEFALMRKDAILINVARGDLIDEAAMVEALVQGRIAAAGLDVFATEPLPPESPLWTLKNVIISPHVAGCSPRYDDYVMEIFTENLSRYLQGQPLLNEVNPQLGY